MSNIELPLQDDDICISEELIGRLRYAAEDTVLELVAALHADRRANLAMHCHRKSHLRQIGLTIASTCDLETLVHVCGPLRGEALFSQSRAVSPQPRKASGRARIAITLARSAGGTYPQPDDVIEDTANYEEAVLA
jgi:hypothetical protein